MGTSASSSSLNAPLDKGDMPLLPWDDLLPELWALIFAKGSPRDFSGMQHASHWTRWLYWQQRTEYVPAKLAHLELHAALRNPTSVASVDLGVLVEKVPESVYVALAGLPRLQRLHYSHEEINDNRLALIGQLRSLRELVWTFRSRALTEDGIANLTNLTNLEVLKMADGGNYSFEVAARVVSSLPRLRALRLGTGGMAHFIPLDSGFGVKVHQEDLSKVKMALGNCNMSHFTTLCNLQQLDLGQYGTPTPQGIQTLTDMTTLSDLSILGGQLLDEASLEVIAALPLVDLVLRKVQFVPSFVVLARCTTLKTLDLTGSFITGADLVALATLPRLERLKISECPKLLDADVRVFYELASPTKLTWVKHADCRRLREFNHRFWFKKRINPLDSTTRYTRIIQSS